MARRARYSTVPLVRNRATVNARRLGVVVPVLVLLCRSTAAFAAQEEEATASPATPGTETTPTPAGARELTAQELEAREHFLRGIEFYQSGDLRPALLEFRRAYELSGNYRVLYNVGQICQELKMYARAIEALEAYLDGHEEEIGAERHAQVRRDLQLLRTKVATISVTVNVEGADLVLDGIPVDTRALSEPIIVDAGEHVLEATRRGYESERRAFTVVAKERLSVDLKLRRYKSVVKVVEKVEKDPVEDRKRVPKVVWIGWGTTGVLAAGAGVTGAVALSYANDLASLRNSPDSTAAERDAAASQARAYSIASDALTTAAIVAGTVSVAATVRPKRRNKSRREMGVGLTPSGVAVKGTF